jgi:hypothetical protein
MQPYPSNLSEAVPAIALAVYVTGDAEPSAQTLKDAAIMLRDTADMPSRRL